MAANAGRAGGDRDPMTYEITLRIRDGAAGPDPQGLKELLAADFEKFGNVHVLTVRALPEDQPRQLKIGGL